jgi:hypothetical protein
VLLDERQHRVEHDDGHDRHRQHDRAVDGSQRCGKPEQQGQRMAELPGQIAQPMHRAGARQLVGPVLHQTACGITAAQPGDGAAQVTLQQGHRLARIGAVLLR